MSLPPGTTATKESLTRPTQQAAGRTVNEVWEKLLRPPDRFCPIDSCLFLDPVITSEEYALRYGDSEASR
jgi:hypothetical protein